MAKIGRYSADRKKVESVTGTAKTVEVSDCGTVFMMDAASSATTFTLPAPTDAGKGWWCKFIVGVDHNDCDHVITSTAANMHTVHVVTADGTAGVTSASAPQLKVTLEGAQSEIGDQYEVLCDGTSYFMTAITESATAYADATS